MAKHGVRFVGRVPAARAAAAARPGARWQPVGVRPTPRIAGRKAWRRPKLRAPVMTAQQWRRLAALALAAAIAMVGGWWLYSSPLLSVRSVSVEGTSVLSAEAVQQMADLEGQSIFRADLSGARERLLALPVVKDVEISRDWPNGVHIAVVERSAWGFWQVGQQRLVIDDEGVVLDLPPPDGAPLIVQTDAAVAPLSLGDRVDAGAVAAARQLVSTAEQALGRSVTALEFSQSAGLTAVLDGDLRLIFGDVQGYEFKIAAAYAVLQQAQSEGKAVQRVDLRFGDRIATQ